MKRTYLFILLSFFLSTLYAQETTNVKWMTVEEVDKAFKEKQKPIFFFFYSEKNDSCLQMLDSLFTQSEVNNYINILFYPIKINIHTTDTITFFDGKVFTNTQNNVHDFAKMMLGDNPKVPAITCFDRKANGTVYLGHKDRDGIFPILTYYAEDLGESITYPEYYEEYIKAYPPGKKQNMSRVLVNWMTFEEAFEKIKTQPRKIFLDINNNYKVACTVMMLTTYNNPKIAKYLNENYYPVRLNAMSKDTIQAFDTTFVNKNGDHPYHDLPVALLNGKMNFPSVFFFNEKGKHIVTFNKYYTPKTFEPLIKFVAEDRFTKEVFENYLKSFKSDFFEE